MYIMDGERFQFTRFTLGKRKSFTQFFLNPDFQFFHLENEIYLRFYRDTN